MTTKGNFPDQEDNEGLVVILALIGFAIFAGVLYGLSN